MRTQALIDLQTSTESFCFVVNKQERMIHHTTLASKSEVFYLFAVWKPFVTFVFLLARPPKVQQGRKKAQAIPQHIHIFRAFCLTILSGKSRKNLLLKTTHKNASKNHQVYSLHYCIISTAIQKNVGIFDVVVNVVGVNLSVKESFSFYSISFKNKKQNVSVLFNI